MTGSRPFACRAARCARCRVANGRSKVPGLASFPSTETKYLPRMHEEGPANSGAATANAIPRQRKASIPIRSAIVVGVLGHRRPCSGFHAVSFSVEEQPFQEAKTL